MAVSIRTENGFPNGSPRSAGRGMTGSEFVRRVRRLGRQRSVPVHFDSRRGKGSHGRLYYGERFTTVKNRKKEISQSLLAAMLKQLGLSAQDI